MLLVRADERQPSLGSSDGRGLSGAGTSGLPLIGDGLEGLTVASRFDETTPLNPRLIFRIISPVDRFIDDESVGMIRVQRGLCSVTADTGSFLHDT